jgi:hypothetical protein
MYQNKGDMNKGDVQRRIGRLAQRLGVFLHVPEWKHPEPSNIDQHPSVCKADQIIGVNIGNQPHPFKL